MYKLATEKLPELLQCWSQGATVYVPQKVGEVTLFRPFKGQGDLALGEGNTLEPPKDLFFPRTEKLYDYWASGKEARLEPVELHPDRAVLVGVRSCDARSFLLLDQVFLTRGYVDEFYKKRRENTAVVALACTQAAPTCFCTSFGIDPGRAEGVDVQMWPVPGGYLLEALTPRGEEMLKQASGLLAPAEGEKIPAPAQPSLQVELEGLVEKLQKMFDHPYWGELSRKCLGCAICTYLCPTCHCFDIDCETIETSGYRFRCWDTCLFAHYTLMAGGRNPRPTRKERLRNRLLHKLQYFVERYGQFACVGCGRCLELCPVNVDITKVIRDVKEVSL
ncbi:MAG TPA: hypothetical protein ENM97_05720 [Moorella mulderi]|nr:hypothetical protein [Moorella mulderi]